MFMEQVREVILDIALAPGLWLSFVLILIYAGAYTAWHSDKLRVLGPNLLAALVGFGIGQIVGEALDVDIARLGQVQVVFGSIGSLLALPIARLRLWRRFRKT